MSRRELASRQCREGSSASRAAAAGGKAFELLAELLDHVVALGLIVHARVDPMGQTAVTAPITSETLVGMGTLIVTARRQAHHLDRPVEDCPLLAPPFSMDVPFAIEPAPSRQAARVLVGLPRL